MTTVHPAESAHRHTAVSASYLRDARREKQLSLRHTATLARIDPAHLSRVERGKKSLSIDALHRLATVLELDDLAHQLHPHLRRKQQIDG